MNPTPEDRQMMQTFVACMDPTSSGHHYAVADTRISAGEDAELYELATEDGKWEFAALLVAVARRAGWTPPKPPEAPADAPDPETLDTST